VRAACELNIIICDLALSAAKKCGRGIQEFEQFQILAIAMSARAAFCCLQKMPLYLAEGGEDVCHKFIKLFGWLVREGQRYNNQTPPTSPSR